MDWELIYSGGTEYLYRTKVPGGWLLKLRYNGYAEGSISITFYPDPLHTWDGKSLP